MQRVSTTCFHFYQAFLIILIPSCVEPDVLMGQERAEHDCQAKQALQRAHYFIYTDNSAILLQSD